MPKVGGTKQKAKRIFVKEDKTSWICDVGSKMEIDIILMSTTGLSLSLYIFIATVVVGRMCNGEERTIVSAMMNI